MMFELPYGKSNVEFNIGSGTIVLEPNKSNMQKQTLAHFREELSETLKPLTGQGNIAIVVSDKSRKMEYPILLPVVTEILLKRGYLKSQIRFYIAYGTHAPQADKESVETYGEVFNQFNFIHHNCETAGFKNLGKTNFGTDVLLREDLLDNEAIITMGAISYHYFAGYGGGRKLLFPGLAARQAIFQNHKLYLDNNAKSVNASCRSGILAGNIVADDLKEISDMLPKRIEIHGILNQHNKLVKLFVGNSYKTFETACAYHNSLYLAKSRDKFDVVVASAGGYPKDINFIQAHKAIQHASYFTKPGGSIVVFAECADGIGNSNFLNLFKYSKGEMFDKVYANYTGNGGTAVSMVCKTSNFKIYMYTNLCKEQCDMLGIRKIDNMKVLNELILSEKSCAILPYATLLINHLSI